MWGILRAGADEEKSTATPHDAILRQFLTKPDFGSNFMGLHLPAELRVICNLSTLKLESGSFVEDNLRQYFSDALYSPIRAGDGYVHVLIEHQSSPDRRMPFRLVRYAVATMQRHLEAGHKKLPLVISVLFYTGKRSRSTTPHGGWMSLTPRRWQADFTAVPCRWLTYRDPG